MPMSDDFEADLNSPILQKDIELSKDKLDFLEANRDKCFLCKWMLEDYKKNGTFTGVRQEGPFGAFEIFPIRGEINHLWLELHQKPYPFKKKVGPKESKIHGAAPQPPPPVAKPVVVVAKPVVSAPAPEPTQAPAVIKNIDAIPVAKPRR